MPSSAASTWKTLTTAHQRSLFAILIYLPYPPPLPSLRWPPWNKPPTVINYPSGGTAWLFFLRKSGFIVPTASLTNFWQANAAKAGADVFGYILFSYEWLTRHERPSRKLIGSDDICLSNNWFKITCCDSRTRKPSRSHLNCLPVENWHQEISKPFPTYCQQSDLDF